MFRAIGFVIVLWGISVYFGPTIKSFNQAATATFATIETAANVTDEHLQDLR